MKYPKWFITEYSTSYRTGSIYKRTKRSTEEYYYVLWAQQGPDGYWFRTPINSLFEVNHIEAMINQWNMKEISEEDVFLKIL